MNRRYFMLSGGAVAGVLALPRAACARSDNNPIILTPKVNQVGYSPVAPKTFAITTAPHAPPEMFHIVAEGGATAFTGKLMRPIDLTATAGELVATGDFSPLDRAGNYRVRVDARLSHPFAVRDRAYLPLLHDAARSFHLIRANAAIDDPLTHIRVAAGHASDARIRVDGQQRDLSGGWYNAGDFGKYTHMAAISVSHMLRLYELRPKTASLPLDFMPLYPDMPDMLQLARWGLEWLLRMQNADGSVLHKVDSQPILTWGKLPADDPAPRRAMAASSIDAGVFVGVMLHASRVLEPLATDFAMRCGIAARRAWAWLRRNPDVPNTDAYYASEDPRQERLWAACEMAVADGTRKLPTSVAEIGVAPLFWGAPQVLGIMSLALAGNTDAAARIEVAALAIADRVSEDAYGYSALPASYDWGSNESALNDAVICLYADHLRHDRVVAAAAQRILDYVLGCNALDHCFVTGHGTRRTEHPYHWIYNLERIAMPGWASGGANGRSKGGDRVLSPIIEAGTPPAKCYVDACADGGGYAANEGQTSENSALLFAVGMLA